jgi:hypothetical protein
VTETQIITLIIAIAGVLHGPLIPAIIGKVRKAGKPQ